MQNIVLILQLATDSVEQSGQYNFEFRSVVNGWINEKNKCGNRIGFSK